MATNTTKLNLPKPDASDNFNRAAYNGLIDAIDANVGAKLDAKIETNKAGAANGVATLGADGKVPASQLNVSAPADASTTQKGVAQLSSATDSASEILAATPKAVKDAKDGLTNQIGILSGLNTTAKNNLVAAVNELFTSASNGKTQIASAITGKGVPASGGDTFPTLTTKIGQINAEVTGEKIIKMQSPIALSKGDRVQYTASIGSKIGNPSILPTATAFKSFYSSDGLYLAVAHSVSPSITIYKRSGDTFTKLSNPTELPTGIGLSVAWSPDSTYLVVGHNASPYMTIYKRSGDTFTKLSNPSTMPTATVSGATFSPNGDILAVAYSSSPYLIIYKRSGDVFTQLVGAATLSSIEGPNDITFSPNGVYMAVAHQNNDFMTIFKRSGDTFTKLASPATKPTGTGNGAAFSCDSNYLAVSHDVSPFVTIYKRTDDTFTKLTNPTSLPVGSGTGVAFSPYGKLLAVSQGSSPYVFFYLQNGDTFTKLANLPSLPPDTCTDVTFSPYETHVTVTHYTSPFFSTYKVTGALSKSDGALVADAMYGYAKSSASASQNVDVAILFK